MHHKKIINSLLILKTVLGPRAVGPKIVLGRGPGWRPKILGLMHHCFFKILSSASLVSLQRQNSN